LGNSCQSVSSPHQRGGGSRILRAVLTPITYSYFYLKLILQNVQTCAWCAVETPAVRLEAGFIWTVYSLTMYPTAIGGAVQNVNSLVSFWFFISVGADIQGCSDLLVNRN